MASRDMDARSFAVKGITDSWALTCAREARLLSTNVMMNKTAPGRNFLFIS